MENYMMNNGMVGDRLSALQRNIVEQRSDNVQAQTGIDNLKYGGEEARTSALDASGLSTGIGGAVFDKSVEKIKGYIFKKGKQALLDKVQPEVDKIKQAKADRLSGNQPDATPPEAPEAPAPPETSNLPAPAQAEDELFGNLPSTQAEKAYDPSKASGQADDDLDLGGGGEEFGDNLVSKGGTQVLQQNTGDASQFLTANMSEADASLTGSLRGGATRGGQVMRSFDATAGDSGQNLGNVFNQSRQQLYSKTETNIPARPAPAPAQGTGSDPSIPPPKENIPDAPDVPDVPATPLRPSVAPETNALDSELQSTRSGFSDKAMSILKDAGVDTGDLSAEELASGLAGKASSLLGDTGSTILGKIGGFLSDSLDVLGPLGEVAGIGMSIYGAIKGGEEADAEASDQAKLAQVSAHINDIGGMSMGSMSIAPMDTESFRGGGGEGNF